jgi:hypothetical protein
MIISQSPVRDSLWIHGFRQNEDAMVRHRNPTYIDVLVVAFPAHTINIFQALDFVFFRDFKKLKASAVRDFGHDSVNDQITQFIQAYEQTAKSMRIRGSFCKAGLTQHISSWPFKLKFDEDRPCESKGFRKIWERNVPIEELSRMR